MDRYIKDGREHLSGAIAHENLEQPAPLDMDSYVARSTMQKAIRRNLTDVALNAAATLLEGDPEVLWRRLLVTQLEDIGVGSRALLQQVAAASTKSMRQLVGDDWSIANAIIRQMCDAPKCQAANDLYNIAVHQQVRTRLTTFEGDVHSPLTSMYRLLSDKLGRVPTQIADQVACLRSEFEDLNSGDLDMYCWAFRRTRLPLAITSLILISEADDGCDFLAQQDKVVDFEWIAGCPSFALDQYTRSGRAAIHDYVKRSSSWRTFALSAGIESQDEFNAAGELIFRAEGAAVDQRRKWSISHSLYRTSLVEGCFMPKEHVLDGLETVRRDLPLLNCLRRQRYRNR